MGPIGLSETPLTPNLHYVTSQKFEYPTPRWKAKILKNGDKFVMQKLGLGGERPDGCFGAHKN
jgi:hypothetical protein